VESSCKLSNEPSGSIKCWEYRVAAQLVASRAVLGSTELVSPYSWLYGDGFMKTIQLINVSCMGKGK
jgi:hypothetical protein